MTLETIDHSEKAVNRITDDLKKENFEKFVTVYTEEIQELEDALIVLANQKDIETVTGVWLDFLGKLVGETRGGRNDEDYRAALKLKIAANTSDGTPDLIMSLARQYTNSTTVRLREGSIAWATLYVNGQTNIDSTFHKLIEDIKPVATRWILESDINNDALDIAYEETVQESLLANINAECGDFQIECADEATECGDSAVKVVTTTNIGYYLPSVNSKNFLAWETVQTQVNSECGEPEMGCGEQGAECGNNITFTETDVIRPLRWEVTEGSLVQP